MRTTRRVIQRLRRIWQMPEVRRAIRNAMFLVLLVVTLWVKQDDAQLAILNIYRALLPHDMTGIERALDHAAYDCRIRDSARFPGPFFIVREIGPYTSGEVEPYPIYLLPGAIGRMDAVTGSFAEAGTLVVVQPEVSWNASETRAASGERVALTCFIDIGDMTRKHVEWLYRTEPHMYSQRHPHAWLLPTSWETTEVAQSSGERTRSPGERIRDELRLVARAVDYIAQRDTAVGTLDTHLAAAMGDLTTVRRLINDGVDPGLADGDGVTPLHCAAYEGRSDVVRVLLSAGAEPSPPDRDAMTPLHLAAQRGHVGVARLLVEGGADLESIDGDGRRPTYHAASERHTDLVSLLVEGGADVMARDVNGGTILHLAASGGSLDMTKLLIAHGADVGAVDGADRTPLHCACAMGREKVAMYLIDHGARIDVTDVEGMTPAQLAADKQFHMLARKVRRAGGAAASSPR